MRFQDLLGDAGILVPMEVADLEGALAAALEAAGDFGARGARQRAADLARGAAGEMARVHDEIVVVLTQEDRVESMRAVLGVAPEPFLVDAAAEERHKEALVLVLLVTPRRHQTLRQQMLPALGRYFREEARVAPLLVVESVDDVKSLEGLMEVELRESLLVEDVASPVRYRVYPDAPCSEVVDLMVRRGLRFVPVVGRDYELLGLVTSGDALKHVVTKTQTEELGGAQAIPAPESAVRDVMTRSVMCVAEDVSLMEAASIMINRDVEELPVICAGQIVGFLTRSEVLRLLFEPAER